MGKITRRKAFSPLAHFLERLTDAMRNEPSQRCRQEEEYPAAQDDGLHAEICLGGQLHHGVRQDTLAEDPYGVAADHDHEEGQDDDEQIAQVQLPEQRELAHTSLL